MGVQGIQFTECASAVKILLNAYACHPDQGSECAVGWNWLLKISREHEVWLLTESNRFEQPTRAALQELSEHLKNVHVIGIHRHRYLEKWSDLAYYHSYKIWQKDALAIAQELDRQVNFDLVHQLNMIGYREPGFLYQLDKPFVWGPVGGFCQMPMGFMWDLGFSGILHYGARNIVNALQMRFARRVRKAMSTADAIVAATPLDREAIQKHFNQTVAIIPETGCDQDNSSTHRQWENGTALKLIWVGALIPRKALHLALRSVAMLPESNLVELHIVGSGSDGDRCRRLARELGIESCCHWHGQVSKSEVKTLMCCSHVLLFPSLQDANPNTVIEALQTGLPVICHDAHGCASVVNDSCGIKIPMSSSQDSVRGFSDALLSLIATPEQIERLSIGAIVRARQFNWQDTTNKMLEVYQSIGR